MTFVEFTVLGSNLRVSINVDAIGMVHQTSTNNAEIFVTGGTGGWVRVNGLYDDVLQAIHKADGDIE